MVIGFSEIGKIFNDSGTAANRLICMTCKKHYLIGTQNEVDSCEDCKTEKPINSGYPLLGEVADEMNKAISQFPTLHSLHEGYAIMLEEVDELWEHVKMNQKRRDKEAIKKECIQIAAMALRIILDCGDMDK